VHSDHLGRPARMTAQNQSWAWDVIYDPFGNVSYSWSNPEVMNIRFPGQWFQLETGLAYNWHRHYDATLGRYVQPDPLGLDALMSDGPSAFGYVGGNPLALVDPAGLATYLANRDIGGSGEVSGADCTCPASADSIPTHTFIFSTNPDGSIAHTYSWGNKENTRGWNLDTALDMSAAEESMRDKLAHFIGPDWIDPYFRQAFDQLKKPENEHVNGWVTNNCKSEANKLRELAWQKWQSNR